MAHISGLVAASVVADLFEYCEFVTTTTHKSLRGARGGVIFFRKDRVLGVDLESAINNVFPSLKVAVCLKFAESPEFKAYQNKSSCCRIDRLGYSLVLGGSDNHLVLVDLRPLGLDGDRVEKILDMASITLNKNSVPDDVSTLVPTLPGGIHIDSPAMTAQGFSKNEIEATAEFIHEGIQITLEANESAPG
ncbi:hypothetical protein CRG98_019370 [Punica granatum]|uniref:Serine hydroxymethyltransferase-like domain-containing protein n=1 Tax=Punica granatum TaxID=22663 RepID=A0A2I0JV98_PUNGR|nr:hypothetical protein CRG98_019370 [Punica granatum]